MAAWAAVHMPFKWTKQVGVAPAALQGLAISWPAASSYAGGIRHQFHHIIDIVPTILEAAGIKAPSMVDGIKQLIEGVSMAYTFYKANAPTLPRSARPSTSMVSPYRGIYNHRPARHDAPASAPPGQRPDIKHLQGRGTRTT